jgi:hypothetical protein
MTMEMNMKRLDTIRDRLAQLQEKKVAKRQAMNLLKSEISEIEFQTMKLQDEALEIFHGYLYVKEGNSND